MDKILFNALEKYFNTISQTGMIGSKEKHNLFVVASAYRIYKMYESYVTKEDKDYFINYIDCHSNHSCLFNNSIIKCCCNNK